MKSKEKIFSQHCLKTSINSFKMSKRCVNYHAITFSVNVFVLIQSTLSPPAKRQKYFKIEKNDESHSFTSPISPSRCNLSCRYLRLFSGFFRITFPFCSGIYFSYHFRAETML